MKLINIIAGILGASILLGCTVINSGSVTTEKVINSRFFLGRDNNSNPNEGLWHIKTVYPGDPYTGLPEEAYNSFIFSKPTGIAYNKDFIIVKRHIGKQPVRYKIIEIRNDSLIRCYLAKNERKFFKIKNKLNVPDSLHFSPIETLLDLDVESMIDSSDEQYKQDNCDIHYKKCSRCGRCFK